MQTLYVVNSANLDKSWSRKEYWSNMIVFQHKSVKTKGYVFKGDGEITLMQSSTCVSSSYDRIDDLMREKMLDATPLKTGDYIFVDGELCIVKIKGDYSDAGVATPHPLNLTLEQYIDWWINNTNPGSQRAKEHVASDNHMLSCVYGIAKSSGIGDSVCLTKFVEEMEKEA